MKTKLTALILIAVMALQLTACGKKNDTENISSLPLESESIVETIDTPSTPDTTSDPTGSKSTDTDTNNEKSSDTSSSASKTEKKNNSSSALSSKNTSSKKSDSAVSSKASSSKASASKAASTTQPTTITTTDGGNTGTVNNQNTVTTVPDTEPIQSTPQQTQPVVSYYEPEPTPQPTPEPEPQPEPDPEPEPPVIDSPYARPFDIEIIRNDMIAYGQERGLILDESLNIDNAAWTSPLNTRWYNDDDAELCFRNCFEEIDSVTTYFDNKYGDHDGVRFNVQIIEIDEYPGEYRIYVPYG